MQTAETAQELRHLLIIELLRAHSSVGGQLSISAMIEDAKRAEAYIRGEPVTTKSEG